MSSGVRGSVGWTMTALTSERNADKPMSENTLGYLMNRAGYHRRHVPHGWRSTFSTLMNERHPLATKIIDLMRAHVPKDKAEAAYNRADHIELRRGYAQEWADVLLDGFPPAASLLKGLVPEAALPVDDVALAPAEDPTSRRTGAVASVSPSSSATRVELLRSAHAHR